MVTLDEAIKHGTRFLEEQCVENPRLDSQLILAHLLNCKHLELHLKRELLLNSSTQKEFSLLLQRRAQREPLQYILGQTHFFDLELKTDIRALIPRPETEILIEHIVKKYSKAPDSVLELGVGSGAVILALAKIFPQSRLMGVDYDQNALELAKENILAQNLTNRIQLRSSDWFSCIKEKFDLIVANPPYLSEAEYHQATPEVQIYEPKQALVASNDGLADLLKIVTEALTYLNPNGMIALETGIHHHNALQTKAKAIGYEHCCSLKDWNGYDRFFFLWTGSPCK